MDNDLFFRKATLRICGDLNIESALQECLFLFRKYLPVTRLHLQRFDPDYGTMHTVAVVTLDEKLQLDTLIPVSNEAKKLLRLQVKSSDDDVRIFNNPQEVPLCKELLDFFDLSCNALMVMRLHINERVLGSLVVITQDNEIYKEEDAKLLAQLREPFSIALSNTLSHLRLVKLNAQLADDNKYLYKEISHITGNSIIGANFGLREVMNKVQQVAKLNSPVLLLGETGTGKDVIANAIHNSSPRRKAPFIKVNCGAIPETLIDSELFGYEKGAFTGALKTSRGRFERAHRGTIFLDEIGELPLQSQVRLLRVLQDKEIERVGGGETIKLDIRFIAATNRDLQKMIAMQQFREDLWFRLNVFPIKIPPLRDRKSDIPALLQHFIARKSKELKLTKEPELAKGAIDDLINYNWPGNVRELQNIVERALILSPSRLSFGNLNLDKASGHIELNKDQETTLTLDEVNCRYIEKILKTTNGRISGEKGAAKLLGLHPNTLRNRMRKLGIKFGRN